MTESFVTQCPHCRTSFKVSHHQLSVARGAVRCGSCKQVFNAARQLLEQSTAPAVAGEPQAGDQTRAPSLTPLPLSQPQWQGTDAHLEQLDLDQELARLERRSADAATRDEAPSILSAQRDQPEDWLDEPFGNLDPDESDRPAPTEATHPARQEPRLNTRDEPSPREAPLLPKASAALRADTSLRADVDDHEQDEPLKGHRPVPDATHRQGRSEPALHEEHLLMLQDDPLQLQWEKPRVSWPKRLLWSTLSLLAGAALLTQYLVFHFDELARHEAYRPWFVTLCPALGCSVPSRVDIQLIRSSNLVVRSHPTFAGALVVDAIIYNRAPFSQPFPLLELRFADLNNKLIASRRFKPSEYLSGDLSGQSEMPPQIPIHIALDILDPGKRAVNYSLSFHSPE